MVWYSHLSKNFPQFVVIHTVKGFGIVNKAEIDVFLELSCVFDDPTDVGNLISGSSAFSKSSLNVWKFTVHLLLKRTMISTLSLFSEFSFFLRASFMCVQNMPTYLTESNITERNKSVGKSIELVTISPNQFSSLPRIVFYNHCINSMVKITNQNKNPKLSITQNCLQITIAPCEVKTVCDI